MSNSLYATKSALAPKIDVVILAGGQAKRMNGTNKLLQQFDDDIQLIKIHKKLHQSAHQIWINSHRDHSLYSHLIHNIRFFQDDEDGFQGPLMGMKSAWSHVKNNYILFIPCDITFIPEDIVTTLYQALTENAQRVVAVAAINDRALYPFCLMRRNAGKVLVQNLANNQKSLHGCFQQLPMCMVPFENKSVVFHSINTQEELKQYQRLRAVIGAKADE